MVVMGVPFHSLLLAPCAGDGIPAMAPTEAVWRRLCTPVNTATEAETCLFLQTLNPSAYACSASIHYLPPRVKQGI